MIKHIRNCLFCLILPFIHSCSPKITSFNYPDKEPDYRMKKVCRLGKVLKESSALEYFNERFWSVNDSGNENLLYSFEPSKKLNINKTEIYPSINIDWESLAQDENYLYIADVGDNYGRRELLKIYLIPKDSLINGNGFVSDSILVKFNEKDPDPGSLKYSHYDCEAITVIHDSIYLFTKNWIDLHSSVYIIPSQPGYYDITSSSVLKTDLLITGADYCNNSGNLWLSGYKNYRPAFILFADFNAYNSQQQSFLRFDFRKHLGLQVEGITVSPEGRIYFSCEKTCFPARLYELKQKD